MPSYARPGIYVNESLAPANPLDSAGTSTAAFLGSHFRGPVGRSVFVSSWSQFANTFGGFPPSGATASELPYAVFNYFNSGGRGCWVTRLAGAGATSASVQLVDRAGAPLPTLRVEAIDAGLWGNDLRVSVIDGASAGRFDLLVYRGGTTNAFLVERWVDLSMSRTDPRHVEAVINSDDSGSSFIKVTNLDSATTGAQAAPAVVTGTALEGGVDGAAVSDSEWATAVTVGSSPLDNVPDVLTLNLPGITTVSVLAAALAYAEDRGTIFVVIDTPAGANPTAAATYAASLPASSYGAVYYPHLIVPDPNANALGVTRACPAGGFVVGKIAETDATRGMWKAPAGLQTVVPNVVGLARNLSSGDLDALHAAQVNAIRRIPGSGFAIMGARTLKRTSDDKYVNVRRTLNYIKRSVALSTEFAVFENNDQLLWSSISAVLERFLGGLYTSGGLRGETADRAFYVKCDADLNTQAVIEAGEVRVEVGVALHRPAEFIVIRVGQWEGGAAVVEVVA